MIQLSNVTISYDEKTVVSDFSLHVKSKQKIVLTGVSGKGKSSILKSIFGLVPINSGSITINEQSLQASNIKSIRNQIFYLHQEPQFYNQTVWETISSIYNFESNKNIGYSNQKLVRYFEDCNLNPSIMQQDVQNLSGGEKQRLGIVIGKFLKRPVWLLDEPVSALDEDNKILIAKLIAKQEATVVIVSHDNVWSFEPFKTQAI